MSHSIDKMTVWIVSEGSPGHVSQSEGVVKALARHLPMDVSFVETRPGLNGFVRKLIYFAMRATGKPLSAGLLARFFHCHPPDGTPALLVASGGKSVLVARSLSLRHSCPLVFVGERKPFPANWFHTVLTPSPYENAPNDIPLEILPVKFNREDIERAAADWESRPSGSLWTMVIGGASTSHRFVGDDWRTLARAMNQLANVHAIRWLVTTSRRTGAAAEEILRAELDTTTVADAVWWSIRPEKRLHALLGAAERIFVTQDSMTMISEAIIANRPVEVIRPEDVHFSPDSFLPHYLKRLEENGYIHIHRTSSLADSSFDAHDPRPTVQDIAIPLLARLPDFIHSHTPPP